jgi:hypothetical protein
MSKEQFMQFDRFRLNTQRLHTAKVTVIAAAALNTKAARSSDTQR